MPEEDEKQGGGSATETEVADREHDEIPREFSVEELVHQLNQELDELAAEQGSFLAGVDATTEEGQMALHEMEELRKEAEDVRFSVLERLAGVVGKFAGLVGEYRAARKQEELAIPDNPKIMERLRDNLRDLDAKLSKMQKEQSKEAGRSYLLTDDKVEWDDQIVEKILAVASEYNGACKQDREKWDLIEFDLSGRLAQYIARLLDSRDLTKALQVWVMMPDLIDGFNSSSNITENIRSTAFRLLEAVKAQKIPPWEEFQETHKRMGQSEEKIFGLWQEEWHAFMKAQLADFPDLWMLYISSDANYYGYGRGLDKTEIQVEALRAMVNSPDHQGFVRFFSWFNGWASQVDLETKQKLFEICLESSARLIIDNFDDFKDQFFALLPEQQESFIRKWACVIGIMYEYEFGHRRDRYPKFARQRNNFVFKGFARIALKPEDFDIFYEAFLPDAKYYKYDKRSEQQQLREKDQKQAYDDFLVDLSDDSIRAFLLNGHVLLQYEDDANLSLEQRTDRLLDALITQNKDLIITNFLTKLQQSHTYPNKWPFTHEQTGRLVSYVIDRQIEKGIRILADNLEDIAYVPLPRSVEEKLIRTLLEKAGNKVVEHSSRFPDSRLGVRSLVENHLSLFIEIFKHHGNEEIFREFIKVLEDSKNHALLDIPDVKMMHDFSEKTSVFDSPALNTYMSIYESSGKDAADEYVDSLQEKSKGLISSEIPAELRAMPEYTYMVKLVFPEGNYSNHEKNLACGDKLEHLAGYTFDRRGSAVEMTGLLGYAVREGETENRALLETYSKRLDTIRGFVSSRGPDNEALQKTFDEKVDAFFEEHAHERFRAIEGLSMKEKLLALFVSEVLRKEGSTVFAPNTEILDLIVEYKYAYHEDLEAYVRQSADEVTGFKDEVSQRYMLWNNLSTVYGENVKHVLRHNIFEELAEKGERYQELVAVFGELIGGEIEEKQLKPKQLERIENTFNNPNISLEDQTVKDKVTGIEKIKPGKFNVLVKQMRDIFGANIKFNSEEERTHFEDEEERTLQGIKSEFTFGSFQKLLPELFALREQHRFGINTKLEEFFSYDLNAIMREVAHYEEKVEVEAKEAVIGGPKHKEVKKSLKKRSIRSMITKTQETANARMGAYLCIAGDTGMWNNEHYFEDVMQDEETGKCVGLTMLLDIPAKSGKKYLWFGPNPFESFLAQVSAEKCFDRQYERACEFAEKNGYDGVVVPSADGAILGQCTNRGGNFPDLIKAKRLRDKKGDLKIAEFGENHTLGGGYGYSDGALIWERGKEKK